MAPMDKNTLKALRLAFKCEFHLASGQSEFTPAAFPLTGTGKVKKRDLREEYKNLFSEQ